MSVTSQVEGIVVRRKWEYLSHSRLDDKSFNELGALGWECYSVHQGYSYFKRELT